MLFNKLVYGVHFVAQSSSAVEAGVHERNLITTLVTTAISSFFVYCKD